MGKSRARIPVGTLTLSYGSSNVGAVTPVQLSASLGQDVNLINIFDNSGVAVKLMIGPAGSETQVLQTSPGCDKDFQTILNKGMRLSLLSPSGTISAGQIVINMYQ